MNKIIRSLTVTSRKQMGRGYGVIGGGGRGGWGRGREGELAWGAQWCLRGMGKRGLISFIFSNIIIHSEGYIKK